MATFSDLKSHFQMKAGGKYIFFRYYLFSCITVACFTENVSEPYGSISMPFQPNRYGENRDFRNLLINAAVASGAAFAKDPAVYLKQHILSRHSLVFAQRATNFSEPLPWIICATDEVIVDSSSHFKARRHALACSRTLPLYRCVLA